MKKRLYPSFSVLLVDDEMPWLRSLSMALSGEDGITNTIQCQDSRQVMDILGRGDVGLVVLDLTMPYLSGEELLTKIAEIFPHVLTIVVTGLNQVEKAVHCMKLGAYDYYVKTNEKDHILTGILHAIRIIELQRESKAINSRLLSDSLERPEAFADIITVSKKMFSIFQYMEAISVSKQPVLITGESGVGKELIAKALHKLSRFEAPMVAINLAGLDDNMFSDTLFGHKRGAFTGAENTRIGLAEQASETILFLDEIGDLSLASQVKLLRLLQDGEYYPVGSDRIKRTKARFILATNQDLSEKQKLGEFRKDLFYRLQTHHIHVPPLRERKEDLRPLLEYFVDEAVQEFGRKRPNISRLITAPLFRYDFPGNIRELRSMVFDAVSRCKGTLSADGFKNLINERQSFDIWSDEDESDGHIIFQSFLSANRLPTYAEAEEILTEVALQRADGSQTLAAQMLGISQPALSKRLNAYKHKEQK